MEIKEELEKYGLTEETYERLLEDCEKKTKHQSDDDWNDIVERYNLDIHYDTLRKSNFGLTGGATVKQYYEEKMSKVTSGSDDEYLIKLQKEKEEIRKERIKLQTVNAERNNIDRAQSRKELYYEQVGSLCSALPVPEFRVIEELAQEDMEYVVAISDLHYGAKFVSQNNEYSPEIFAERLEYLTGRLIDFVNKNKITKLHVACLGDVVQNILRLSDLKLNDSSVVKATVEVSRLLARFLIELSKYTYITYYHVGSSNHGQIRYLNAKANQLSDEDFEYVVSHYIQDLCSANERIEVVLPEEGKQYIMLNLRNSTVIAMHGHQIRNMETAIKDLNALLKIEIDSLLLGHYHAAREITVDEGVLGDADVLVASSFCGSDPYANSLMKGSKAAAQIYGFSLEGHVETKKIVLN